MNRSNLIEMCNVLLLIFFLSLVIACGGGGSGGGGSSSHAYSALFDEQVATYKATYGKSDEWENWMVANKSRYLDAFAASSTRPDTITISFRYDTTIDYDPAWSDEGEHMDALATMAEGAYAGYFFNILFEGDTATSYANIIAGIATNSSYASGKNVYVYYETIFNHEFGHVMNLLHHYDSVDDIGGGRHMPPGDTTCIMDRTATTFCSACRTALGIPLGILDTTDMDTAVDDILGRYPY